MADPVEYEPQFDFSNYQSTNPSRPLPGHELDVELWNISNAMGETQTALADIRRSDGQLKNGIVTEDSLVPGLVDGLVNGAITEAEAAAAAAQEDADRAEGAAVNALIGTPYGFDTVALLKANTSLSYTAGTGKVVVSAGQYILAGGFRYQVAASVASGHHLTTAGGVKLYVQPGADGQYYLPAWGVAFGAAGNIAAVSSYLAARATVLDLPVIERNVPTPKLHLVSEVANGKPFQGLPAAVRHSGNDIIVYREGIGHTETTPFGAKARLVCAVRPVAGIAPTSRTVVYSPTDIDPRDPNILRDDFGNAILVGGKLKVVMFEWAGSYSSGNTTVKVFDLDPSNIAAGLTSPVSVPAPVLAVKSDVRLLDSGAYAFIGYSNTCYLVTTTDWATFTIEEIGPGNEAAFCQTQDGALIVVARAEENYGPAATVFYKKPLGGAWTVQDVLPYTLNAPTLVKSQAYRVIGGYPEGNDGWLLFARDKTGRTRLTNSAVPVSDLVVFRSKEAFAQGINRFTDRAVIAGQPRGNLGSSGDGHYASVITSTYSGDVQIYTYGEFRTAFENADTSFAVGLWRIAALTDPDRIIVPEAMQRQNLVANGDFSQGKAGFDIANANVALVTDAATGHTILRLTNTITSAVPSVVVKCQKGQTYYLKLRMRLNASNLTNGRHVLVTIYDYSTGSAVFLRTETPELTPDDFGSAWVNVVTRPFVAPSDVLLLALTTTAGMTAAETDIACIEVSDDYKPAMIAPPRVQPATAMADVLFTVTPTGGAKASGTYTNAIWGVLGLVKSSTGLPIPAVTEADIAISLTNATTQAGALRCVCTSATVSAAGVVAAHFAVAPGESGTMSGSVACRMAVAIKVP